MHEGLRVVAWGRRRPTAVARMALVLVVVALTLVASASRVGATPRGARPRQDVPAGPSTTVPDGDPSPVVAGSNGPQPVGRSEPPRAQRIGDSVIWLWVVLVLVGGALFGAFAGRRRSGSEAGDGH